nr:DNA methyltransferase [bacterium]
MKHNYLINWIGGKRLLRHRISELIPDDICTYIEPFGGGAWVLFYKDKWADLEIYNDLNDKLVNLFKCVKFHPDELIKEFRWMIASRKIFKETLEGSAYTDIQKAAKFFYLVSRSFGGAQRHFGTGKRAGGAMKSHKNILARIEAISGRLDRVVIENLDFEELFNRYDYKDAFFYCDPPYTSGAGYEVTSTKDFDHERLKDCLKNLKGRFLLSYDDSEKVRELYKGFEMIEVSRQKGINNKCPNGREYKELLIKNY